MKKYLAGFNVGMLLMGGFMLPADVAACTSCLCGDPTLTTLGTEKPYAGRMQFSWEALYREEESGQKGVNRQTVDELRHTLNASYWPKKNIGVSVALPIMSTLNLTTINGANQRASGVGDIDVNGRYYHWQNRRFNAGFIAGMRLATGREQKTASDQSINIDAQPAQGIYQGRLGLWYSRYQYPWSYHTSVIAYAALNEGFQGFEPGEQMTVNTVGQYAVTKVVSVMFGLEARLGRKDDFYGEQDKNSGGTIAYGVAGIVGKWGESGVWHIKVQATAYNGLHGSQKEPFVIYTGLGYGF